jgi:hypothetical protein
MSFLNEPVNRRPFTELSQRNPVAAVTFDSQERAAGDALEVGRQLGRCPTRRLAQLRADRPGTVSIIRNAYRNRLTAISAPPPLTRDS